MTKIKTMIKHWSSLAFIRVFALAFMFGFPLAKAHAIGAPHRWQIGFQEAGSPVMIQVESFHHFLLWVIFIVALVVGVVLLYIIIRFRNSRSRRPSKTAHNTKLEVLWTLVPLAVVLYMLYPSLKLIYFMDVVPKADMTLKAVGHQWYWSYEYPDNNNLEFESRMIPTSELQPGQVRLLSTDNPVVLPVGTAVRVITTSSDVIHSWAMPSLGVKKDAVPGRLNEIWLRINKEGTYFGQCSELCGSGHGFMPIEIKAVSKDAFEQWIKIKKQESDA